MTKLCGVVPPGILMTYGDQPCHREVERVPAALLVLATGDLARLRHFTMRARQAYRDVLMWRSHRQGHRGAPPTDDASAGRS